MAEKGANEDGGEIILCFSLERHGILVALDGVISSEEGAVWLTAVLLYSMA